METDHSNTEYIHTGLTVESLKRAFVDSLKYERGRFPALATKLDFYWAVASSIRDRLLERWVNTVQTFVQQDARVVCYFSAEYLLGRHLGKNLLNLGIGAEAKQAMEELGLNVGEIFDQEEEPGLGNGGLGRLAACYMDSMATLDVPAIGYGIRYEYGIFDQLIRDGWQVESTDNWLQWGNPWEIARPESAATVGFGGHTEPYDNQPGSLRKRWIPERAVKAVPYDTPILGFKTNTANTLRLWKAEAVTSFDLDAFATGDYFGSVKEKMRSENISKILYPRDEDQKGKELRLEQQYFFVAASIQDMMRIHARQGRSVTGFDRKFAVQMNDTHPSVSVPELMRVFVDEHGIDWDQAWDITQHARLYQSHPAPRGFGKMAARTLPEIASASPRDHLRDQQPFSGRSSC